MFELKIENIVVKSNIEIERNEALAYVLWAQKQYVGKTISEIVLNFEGEEVGVETHLAPQSFEKIRRITGYLVGTVDRFNDGKRAEERDRVKHM